MDAGFYSTFSYIFSVVLMHLPLASLEVFIFGTTLYYMSSFTDDAGRWCGYHTHTHAHCSAGWVAMEQSGWLA